MKVREYLTPNGRSPFRQWLAKLDSSVRARIQARVLRFEMGTLGDHKSVGAGVWEARIDFGAGYRIYFSKERGSTILILLGGDKNSQRRDIREAKRLRRDFLWGTDSGAA